MPLSPFNQNLPTNMSHEKTKTSGYDTPSLLGKGSIELHNETEVGTRGHVPKKRNVTEVRDTEGKMQFDNHLQHSIIDEKELDNQFANYDRENTEVGMINKPRIILKKGIKVSLKKVEEKKKERTRGDAVNLKKRNASDSNALVQEVIKRIDDIYEDKLLPKKLYKRPSSKNRYTPRSDLHLLSETM